MNSLLSLFNLWQLSPAILLITLGWAISLTLFVRYKKKGTITPNKVLFIGIFISAVTYFLPMYMTQLPLFESIINSIHHAFRLFALDDGYMDFVASFEHYPESIKALYIQLGAVLYLFAPLLTFGFILSFFKNMSAYFHYLLAFPMRAHVFSELNSKSLALAKDIVKNDKKFLGFIPCELIVFTDYIKKTEEIGLELAEDAKEIGAVLFTKDLESVKYRAKHSLRKVNFYLISENEPEKIRHAEYIMRQYDLKNVSLLVFSYDIRTELLLATKSVRNMQVARVNDIQSLIYHNLDLNGINLFERSRVNSEGEKVISAIIVGLGRYGSEMLKALTWYCQLPGYKLKINAFDTNEKALENFTQQCPELMSERYNNQAMEGEPYYDIKIHSGIDVSVLEFEKQLSEIKDATYIFVSLGTDEINLEVSKQIRSLCERVNYEGGRKPDIETVIYNSDLAKEMRVTWEDILTNAPQGITNYKNQPYNILMIGDLEHFYSCDTVINSGLVNTAWEFHLRFCLSYAKSLFAENHMQEEWAAFLEKFGIADEWNSYLREWKAQNNIDANAPYKLSQAKKGFSFMKACEVALSNTDVTRRKDYWYKLVEQKVNLWPFTSKALKAEWDAVYKEEFISAKNSFWLYEYNYNSSIAQALHARLKEKLEATSDFSISSRTEEEKRIIEHIRWNAYMRTKGYRYGAKRNDLAMEHPDLIPATVLLKSELSKNL